MIRLADRRLFLAFVPLALVPLALAAAPAAAQSFPGSAAGLPSTYVPAGPPPNPFASNYPSAPPAATVERPRGARAVRRRDVREDRAPVPPGRVPR